MNDAAEIISFALYLLEESKPTVIEKLFMIDAIADYIYPHEEDDYIDGEINIYKPVAIFISKMQDADEFGYRDIIIKELEKVEMFNVLTEIVKNGR